VYARPEHAGAIGGTAFVSENLLRVAARCAGVASDQLAVRIAAGLPDPAQAALLKIGRCDCVTTLLVSALHGARPLLAVEAVVATGRRPIEAVFPAM